MTPPHVQHTALEAELAALPLFAGLAQKTLARLARGAVVIDAAAGTALFSRGEACDGLFGVLAGRVKLSLPLRPAVEKVVALVGPGHTFAESAVFLDEPHDLSAETLTRSRLVHVQRRALLAVLRGDPFFASRVVQALSRRVRELVTQVESAAMMTGTQRVVDFLVRELRGESAAGPSTIALPAKKRIIASQLGLTQEHFSRILHELATESVVIVHGSTLTVPDTARLRAYHDISRQLQQAQDARRRSVHAPSSR